MFFNLIVFAFFLPILTGLYDSHRQSWILSVEDGLIGKNYTQELESFGLIWLFFSSKYGPQIDNRSSFAVNKNYFDIFRFLLRLSIQSLVKKYEMKILMRAETSPYQKFG